MADIQADGSSLRSPVNNNKKVHKFVSFKFQRKHFNIFTSVSLSQSEKRFELKNVQRKHFNIFTSVSLSQSEKRFELKNVPFFRTLTLSVYYNNI